MKTSDLIDMLAQDDPVGRSERGTLFGAMAVGFIAALVLTGMLLGFRPVPVLAGTDVLAKLAFTGSLLVLAIPALLRTLRPGSRTGRWRFLPLAAAVAVALAAVVEIGLAPRVAVWRWDTPFCLVLIPLFSLPAFYMMARAARLQAPTRLPDAGLFIGLAAGAVSASAYALHCPNDDPVYLAAWYLPAVLVSGLIGRTLGTRFLAW